MSYLEIVQRALKNHRSVNSASKAWGVPQSTLDAYVKGKRLPDYLTARILAKDAGVTGDEMLDALAEEEGKRRSKLEKISASFKSFFRRANVELVRLPATA